MPTIFRDRRTFEQDGWELFNPGLFSEAEIATAAVEGRDRYPSASDVESRAPGATWVVGDEFSSMLPWPTGIASIDRLPLSPELVQLARRLIGTSDIQLLRAAIQCKYAGAARYEQVHHYEYYDHCLVVPSDRPGDRLVGMFVYFEDVTPENGPTALVSLRDTTSLNASHRLVHRSSMPWLYDSEELAIGRAGSVLVHSTKTYHRATEVRSGSRFTMSLAFAPRLSWYGFVSWPHAAESDDFAAVVRTLDRDQLSILGFPPVDSAFWEDETSAIELERRYGKRL